MTFDVSLTNIILATLIGLAAFWVCWQSWKRSGYKPRMLMLELFRFVLIALGAFTLFQPTMVSTSQSDPKSVVKVLVDHSGSMLTKDIDHDGKLKSRAMAVESMSDEATWEDASSIHSIEIGAFAGQPNTTPSGSNVDAAHEPTSETMGSATDLHAALDEVASNPGDVRGIVLASDGDWNIGTAPAAAARKLRQLGIPVYTVAAGSPTAQPDLAVTNFDLPTFAVVGKQLRIPFGITSTLTEPADVDVTITLPDGKQQVIPMQVPAGETVESVVGWRPAKLGSQQVSISIPKHPTERVESNNQQTLPINIRYESLRVLMIDSYPRWEYRYTRNALVRDPGVTVNTLLLHPDIPEHGGGQGYLDKFPTTEELAKYDVVFLGDVGVADGQLTIENCDELIQLVRNQAAGIVFLPGFRGLQATLSDTSIQELMPVEMDAGRPEGERSSSPAAFLLTEAGNESLLTRFETDAETNAKIWKALPGFFWHASALRAKPNANVLAVHNSKRNQFGRMPLVVTRAFGTGKVLYVGTDSAWRWRKGVEDLYHYRFWSQMVRWMAYQRTMSAGESMRLIYSPDRPRSGDTINLLVNAMGENGEPLQRGHITTQVVTPSGKTETLNLTSESGKSWGLFRSAFVANEAGAFKLLTTCRETGSQLETEVNVQGVPREKTGQPARLDVMQEIASITRGKAINIASGDLSEVVDAIKKLPPPEPLSQQYQLWSHPAWGLSLILLLGVYWGTRKMQGLL